MNANRQPRLALHPCLAASCSAGKSAASFWHAHEALQGFAPAVEKAIDLEATNAELLRPLDCVSFIGDLAVKFATRPHARVDRFDLVFLDGHSHDSILTEIANCVKRES